MKTVANDNEVILVVDDEVALQDLVKVQLDAVGYKVLTASSGIEALEMLARENTVHLLMTDIVMPGMSGFELAEQVMEKYPEIKILLVSGYTGKTVLANDSQKKFTENMLNKPYKLVELAQKIRQIFEEE